MTAGKYIRRQAKRADALNRSIALAKKEPYVTPSELRRQMRTPR